MKRVLIIYYSLTGNTEKMAEYIAEGVRFNGHEVLVKKTSDITNREDIRGFDGYIFGSPTHHRDMAQDMKDFLLIPRREDLKGKLAGSFGSYTHSGGDAPTILLKTMEHVFQMKPSELGPFNLVETLVETTDGLHTSHDYGRVFGEELG
ncbi:MAG: flavodoxin domain-containing protein [Dehalococcoidales bacterium]|jgi:flavodoxin|nr:flavodoxin domain-containing protein [Dehalococcoidales bacterium]